LHHWKHFHSGALLVLYYFHCHCCYHAYYYFWYYHNFSCRKSVQIGFFWFSLAWRHQRPEKVRNPTSCTLHDVPRSFLLNIDTLFYRSFSSNIRSLLPQLLRCPSWLQQLFRELS
jgi:hypothetical protein